VLRGKSRSRFHRRKAGHELLKKSLLLALPSRSRLFFSPGLLSATVGANTAPSTAMIMSAPKTTGTVGTQAIACELPIKAAPPVTSRPR
jgi:hypothetical protein